MAPKKIKQRQMLRATRRRIAKPVAETSPTWKLTEAGNKATVYVKPIAASVVSQMPKATVTFVGMSISDLIRLHTKASFARINRILLRQPKQVRTEE